MGLSVFAADSRQPPNPNKRSPMKFDLTAFESDLRHLVDIDSGSHCVEGVNTVCKWFEDRIRAVGLPTRIIAQDPVNYGNSLYTWYGDPDDLDLLILCHTDTVFPEGVARERPFAVEQGRYTGPGVADMKAGCLMTLVVIEQLLQEKKLSGNIGIFFNGEHEISCPTTRTFLEVQSLKAKVVVATEPARANGACVRQRKGILRYKIEFHGKSAHSGVNPENGVCAVTEMARMIQRLKELENPGKGITVNPGIVRAGTSINVIPDKAECHLDIRVVEQADGPEMDKMVREIASSPTDSRVRVELSGGVTRPPLTPSDRGDELIRAINQIGEAYGIEVKWDFSGGGSDASFASALGIPALCGLGPVGGGYHTEGEYLQTVDLQERLCIFRDFVEAIGNRQI